MRDLPIGPFGGAGDLLDRAPEGLARPLAAAAGALIGAVLAGIGEYESLRLRLTPSEVTLRRKDVTTTIARADIADVFVDGKRLVLLDRDGREQASETVDTGTDRLAAAFEQLGYPWRPDGDPYAGDFRRWVPGMPGLPASAGSLMVARQRALERSDQDEARLLRAELGGVGVVVRDQQGKQQHWRPVRSR